MSFKEASSPFDKASNVPATDNLLPIADLIVRSCDGTRFYVHKAILSRASHAFAAMLSGGDATNATGEDPKEQVVELEENACTLDALFRICYPTTDPVLKDARAVLDVMEASKKYIVDHAFDFCKNALVSPKILENDPFSVFAIACHYGLAEIARKAARQSLHVKFPPSKSPVGLERLSGSTLYSILQYRENCKGAVRRRVNTEEFWLETIDDPQTRNLLRFACKVCDPLQWQYDERNRLIEVDPTAYYRLVPHLLKDTPCWVPQEETARMLTSMMLLELKSTNWSCQSCREEVINTLQDFHNEVVMEVIDRAVSQVKLQLEFDE
ncbi:hypothetical protein OBBRIDRAFT_753061 [Obba rivulosa]|uniref:BTB domain-containing protein n=1 Tax=Obba rivulosa TaxID=1052685 RepID=A0A8E2AVS5_9APHY|nr:hypothetical protein OBBRIDRAFT_753061 [Obba rivulosa]